MLKQQKLFLFLCIPFRILLVILAKYISPNYLPYLGYISLIIAIGFASIYLTNSRKTGPEVFGGQIWWNYLRPVHSLLYFLFAYNAIIGNKQSWIFLLSDVVIGLISFLIYHYVNGNLSLLFRS